MSHAWPYQLIVAILLAIAAPKICGQPLARAPAYGVCAQLKPLLTKPPGQQFYSLILYGDTSSAVQRFSNVDIDHDGEPDKLELSCPGSTIEPGDPCLLEVQASSGSSYTVEGMPLYVLRYKNVIYAVSGLFSEWPRTHHVNLYRLTASGPEPTCAFVRPTK